MIDRHVTLLPEPDSPTMPSVSALLDREADTVDRPDDAVVGVEVRLQVVDFEEGPWLIRRVRLSRAGCADR